jgi:transcriptional regulator with XRE-family HTH domain
MQDPLEIRICARLREERRRLGLTQDDLRSLCDTTVQTIRRWEKNTPIPCDKLARITPSGIDGQYVVTGIRSTNLQTVAAGDTEVPDTDQRMLALLRTLTAEQRNALLAFLDALSSGKPST